MGITQFFYTRLKKYIKQEGIYFGALFVDFVWDKRYIQGQKHFCEYLE